MILGTFGNDILIGTSGADYLIAMCGNDVVRGGAGNDRIRGGAGDDILSGGRGADQFDFDLDNGIERDVIRDWDSSDSIVIEGGAWDVHITKIGSNHHQVVVTGFDLIIDVIGRGFSESDITFA